MNDPGLQIGLPCVYEQFCYWSGVLVAVFFIGLIGGIVISVWRDKIKQDKKRQKKTKTQKNLERVSVY